MVLVVSSGTVIDDRWYVTFMREEAHCAYIVSSSLEARQNYQRIAMPRMRAVWTEQHLTDSLMTIQQSTEGADENSEQISLVASHEQLIPQVLRFFPRSLRRDSMHEVVAFDGWIDDDGWL